MKNLEFDSSAVGRSSEYLLVVSAVMAIPSRKLYLRADNFVGYQGSPLEATAPEASEINRLWGSILADTWSVVGVGYYDELYLNRIKRQHGTCLTSRDTLLLVKLQDGEELSWLQEEVRLGSRSARADGAIIVGASVGKYWRAHRQVEQVGEAIYVHAVSERELEESAARLARGLLPRRVYDTPAYARGVGGYNTRVTYKAMALMLLGALTQDPSVLEQLDVTERCEVLLPVPNSYIETVFSSLWLQVTGTWSRIVEVRMWAASDVPSQSLLLVELDGIYNAVRLAT